MIKQITRIALKEMGWNLRDEKSSWAQGSVTGTVNTAMNPRVIVQQSCSERGLQACLHVQYSTRRLQ